MKQKNEFVVRNKEFFECDCFGKDDLIRAEYEIEDWTTKNGETHTFRELTIVFTTKLADYNATWRTGFSGWFKKKIWRIKKAFEILFRGEVETEGYFMPCRTWVDQDDNPIEGQFGYETTKNLAKFLNTKADEIKEAYERDMKEYQESQQKAKENLNKSTGTIETA